MIDLLTRPWPWYVTGPLIGLFVPLVLIIVRSWMGNDRVKSETIPFVRNAEYLLSVPSVMVRATAVLCLHATLVMSASALAHGHDHHERAHAHHLTDAAVPAGVGEVGHEDGSDHYHAVASPVVPPRFATSTGFAAPSKFEALSAESRRVSSAQPTSLDARAPPARTPPSDSRPRSPPAV